MIDETDFHVAAALCTTSTERLYHLMCLCGLQEHALEVRAVNKRQLIARIVTSGVDGDFSPGEMLLVTVVCLQQMRDAGATKDDLRIMLQRLAGQVEGRNVEHTVRDLLRRLRERAGS